MEGWYSDFAEEARVAEELFVDRGMRQEEPVI